MYKRQPQQGVLLDAALARDTGVSVGETLPVSVDDTTSVEQHALLRPGDGPAVLMQVDGPVSYTHLSRQRLRSERRYIFLSPGGLAQ